MLRLEIIFPFSFVHLTNEESFYNGKMSFYLSITNVNSDTVLFGPRTCFQKLLVQRWQVPFKEFSSFLTGSDVCSPEKRNLKSWCASAASWHLQCCPMVGVPSGGSIEMMAAVKKCWQSRHLIIYLSLQGRGVLDSATWHALKDMG